MALPDTFEAWVQWLTYVPLVLCSVIGSTLTIVKWLQFRRPHLPSETLVSEVARLLASRQTEEATARLSTDTARGVPMIRAAILSMGMPRDAVREQVTLSGRRVNAEMEHGLGTLALLTSLGPLFGLLGTVVGIVLVFDQLSTGGGATPADLAGGIGTALYTTIIGLVIGILALVCHRYFSSRVDWAMGDLEVLGARLVNMVDGIRT
jgi:biopolymer transport protein ExbB